MSLMKFFTPEWRDGELDDEDFENAVVLYERRLREIHASLPAAVQQFVSDVSLHDGLVRTGEADAGAFRLLIRVGDLQRGYSDVDVRYRNVELLQGAPSVAYVLSLQEEIVCDEIDLVGGSIEHRLLFAADGELLVRFQDIDFHVTPVDSRTFERLDPVFIDRR